MRLLKRIRAGTVDPATLAPDQRRPLVALLTAEGQSTAEIAHLLHISDRTIERDKNAIREKNALYKDPELANIVAGRLSEEAQNCIQRIRRFQRDSNCPPAAKIEGERACFQIVNTMVERLQSIGHLPTAAKKVEADLITHTEDDLPLREIQSETQRLLDIKRSFRKKKVKKVKSKTWKEKEEEK
jgi:hypothetical protein